ncbi:MAG: hypothetical protein H6811_08575 [Phycisphaeraceae bacterium]|nr:hypothetical protein [Phycisphaeraceae bacterium]
MFRDGSDLPVIVKRRPAGTGDTPVDVSDDFQVQLIGAGTDWCVCLVVIEPKTGESFEDDTQYIITARAGVLKCAQTTAGSPPDVDWAADANEQYRFTVQTP